ncbi:MAG: SulP family inorganic anion transporter [Candidatus Peribacteraceae bacterium]|nr:SulP family inorganic anion transporter [Candidatus Peribacteraceae bacterium]
MSSPLSFLSPRTVGRQIGQNWKSGVTVSLVSIPLSVSLAIAAGATPVMGVITAIWAGIVASIFGGSNYNIIGPTGALSGVLAAASFRYGVGALPVLAVLSGILIFVFYMLRWDRYIIFIPSAVTHGFTLGLAFIIAVSHLNFAVGLTELHVHEHLTDNMIESFRHIGDVSWPAVGLFAVSLALLFLILKYMPRIPSPIIVAAGGLALGYAASMGWSPWQFETLLTTYGTMRMQIIAFPGFQMPPLTVVLGQSVIVIATVAILETLISAKVADAMTNTRHDQRREVFGLALANIISGLAGGLPATAAHARTTLNVKSGAHSRMSAFLNSVFVFLIALMFFTQFQYLPLPVVAAILVYVAIRMVEKDHWLELARLDRTMFIVAMLVAVTTVLWDPIVGLMAGSVVALLIFVQHLSIGRSDITIHRDRKVIGRLSASTLHEQQDHGDVTVYRFAGELTYFNAESHTHSIKRLTCKTLILSFRNLFFLDVDGLHALGEIIAERQAQDINVILTAVSASNRKMLRKTGWFRQMESDSKVFDSSTDALMYLGFPLR